MRLILTIVVFVLISARAPECTTVDGQIAAVSEKYLDDAISYAVDKDYVALQKLIDAGAVITMKGGMKVFVVKAGLTKVQFRLPGSTDVLWTVREGVKC